jgi:hypothetical protein
MSSKRTHYYEPTLSLWTSQGRRSYSTTAAQLDAALASSGRDEVELRRRLGHGFPILAQARAGAVLGPWEVMMVETAVLPDLQGSRMTTTHQTGQAPHYPAVEARTDPGALEPGSWAARRADG